MEVWINTWEMLSSIYFILSVGAYVWAPLLLAYVLFILWVRYIRMIRISRMNFITLELKLPKIIEKTPAAMELVLNSMYRTHNINRTYASNKGAQT